METLGQFQKRLQDAMNEIGADAFSYREDEFWMIRSPYEYLEFYAARNRLWNTSLALALARGLHDGVYRKSQLVKNGVSYRVPYVIHPLLVTRMLVDMNIPISEEEEDILLAASMCHDMIEDLDFPNHGRELTEVYHLDPRVYETVQKVSKRKDFTPEEERTFFHHIEEDKLALLIKLSDRGHNVEDLYNRKVWKVHEYVGETRKFFLPMSRYGIHHYPELRTTIEILQDKIISLTQSAEIFVDRYSAREQEMQRELEELTRENERLRMIWKQLWEE